MAKKTKKPISREEIAGILSALCNETRGMKAPPPNGLMFYGARDFELDYEFWLKFLESDHPKI